MMAMSTPGILRQMKEILDSNTRAMKIFLVQGNLYRKSGIRCMRKLRKSFGLCAKRCIFRW